MHRLLSMHHQALSFSQSFGRSKKCLQCRMRHLSTISTLPNIGSSANTIRKKRIRNNKKYAELLVVGDKSNIEQKSIKVRTLRPDELGRLALSNLDLSEMYKLKHISSKGNESATEHTYNNLTDTDNLPSSKDTELLYSDFIHDFFTTASGPIIKYHFYHPPKRKEAIIDLPLVNTPHMIQTDNVDIEFSALYSVEEAEENDLLTAESDADFDPLDEPLVVITPNTSKIAGAAAATTQTQPNLRKTAVSAEIKAEIAARTLTSYIDICNSLKYSLRGLQALQFHRRRHNKRDIAFTTLTGNISGVSTIYIGLLRGFAARADLPHIKEVLNCAKEDGVPLPLDGHAAVLECLGRLVSSKTDSMLGEIEIATNALIDAGLTFDDIINKGIFLNDQRTFVLIAMRQFDPHYEPRFTLPNVQYDNKLVNDLNHSNQLTDPFAILQQKNEDNYLNGPCSQVKLQAAITAQLEIEQNVYVKVRSIENAHDDSDVSSEVRLYRRALERQRKLWQDSAQAALARDLGALTARGVGGAPHLLESYMRSVPARDLVEILITEAEKVAQGSETYSPTTLLLYRELGMKVWSRYRVLRRLRTGVQDSITAVHKEYCSRYYAPLHDVAHQHKPSRDDRINATINQRQAWQWLIWRHKQDTDTSVELEGREWPSTAVQSVGRFLYHIVMHDLKVDVNSLSQTSSSNKSSTSNSNYLPAFYTVFRTQGGSSASHSHAIKEEVKPHPVLARLYRASRPSNLNFPAYELPMLCPPVPWMGVGAPDTNSTPPGGYLMQPTNLIRLPPSAQMQRDLLESMDRRQLYPALDALNHLSAVPWKVNEPVLDVLLQVFRKGGDAQLGVPESTTKIASMSAEGNSEPTMSLRQRLQLKRKRSEMYSMWCDCLYRLSLANHYRGHTFWLPHNLDFRGRTYPVPPHLSHLGSDLARSILVFAEARPLGPRGFDWLKHHLANLTGAKKRDPLDERLRWVNEQMENVLDSANKPLDGSRWWVEADEPWQTLSCCMEIARIQKEIDSGRKVDEIESHFPVHQDGSCNGLQHYAALGRDKQGAHSVNLCSNIVIPQDVYTSVATLVEEKRRNDAQQGHIVAKVLDGFVKRKVIKQTVMTTVYGVTRFGARLQIARQLRDLSNATHGPKFPREHVWAASNYLTARTFDSLRSMFNSAREIQDWFTDCAKLISSVCGKSVEWRTPLGLPIVQPYCRLRQIIHSSDQTYAHFAMDKHERPNVMKQKNAFPPNFIHSLDSSHMMLTALWAERTPITFVSVHDCYWTHPSTVDIMNKLCREQFVALHSEPILDDLSTYLSDLYSYRECEMFNDGSVLDLTKKKLNRKLSKLPKTGTFDIKEVLNSTYFFS